MTTLSPLKNKNLTRKNTKLNLHIVHDFGRTRAARAARAAICKLASVLRVVTNFITHVVFPLKQWLHI